MLTRLIPGRSERLFARFRARGDAAALGRVFDRTAPELFGLALRLAPAPELAQDLVQATFLSAIESAARWDAGRPLVPWLVGILVREARMLRRRERRALDPERLERQAAPDPSCLAQDEEFARALGAALEVLPAKYREVLLLHLHAEKPAAEIAAELGREPGTVRVQLHRGLELLRKALPAGMALGGALAVGSPRALAAVRERVLARAAEHVVGAGVVPVVVGGIALKKVSLALLVALAVGGVLWVVRVPRAEIPSVAAERARSSASAPADARPGLVEPTIEGTRVAAPRETVPGERGSSAPVQTRRSGIHGRLVEEDGTPLPGTLVALNGIPPELFVLDALAALEGVARAHGPTLASARTDAGGRFTIQGALPRAVHALGIDPGGPRATLRVLEEALHPGETTDLGDVVLAASGAIVGRVVDEAGQPLAGVRVRVAELPQGVLELDLHRLRATSVLVARSGRRQPLAVLELAPWTFELLERLPIPSATTGADGTFVLRGPLGAELTLVADDAQHEPCLLPGVQLGSGTRDVGTIVLRSGRTLVCRVRDASGNALDGAEVCAGTLGEREELAVCARAEPVGEAGLYRLTGAASGPEVYAIRVGAGPWLVAGPFAGAGAREVRLGAPRTLALDVRDEQGDAVPGLRLALQPADSLARAHETAFLVPVRAIEATLQPGSTTSYAVPGLAEGRYNLFARADGCAPLRAEVEVRGESPGVRLVFGRSGTLEVRVLDDASGAALPGVEVSALTGLQGRTTRVAGGRTDGEGRVRLERITPQAREAAFVRAELEGFAVAGVRVEDGERELELRLVRPASVIGRVHAAGRAPGHRCLIVLQPLDEALRNPLNVPFHALTDGEGRFRVSEVPPGMHRYQVGERFLADDPLLDLLGGRFGESFDVDKGILERRLQDGVLELDAGEEALLEIDLAPATASGTVLRGRIVQDGRGRAGLQVELDADKIELVRRCDERGTFDFGRVPAGKARLKVEDVARDRTVLRAELELVEGEERVLELSFDPLTLDLCLVGPAGPLVASELKLWPQSSLYDDEPISARTDAAGCCRVTLPGCARYHWSAEAGDAKASGELDVLSGERLVLTFRPRVSLSGTLVLAPELLGDERISFLSVRSLGDDTSPELHPLDPAQPDFALDLAGAGRYELRAVCGDRWSRALEIDVPATGLTGQRFVLEGE